MSENRHHSKVHVVPSAPVACMGAVLAGAVIYLFIRSLSYGAQKAYEQLSSPVSPAKSNCPLKPPTEMSCQTNAERKRIAQELGKYNLSPVESIKVSTLLSVSNMPYMIESRETVLNPLENFIKAKSIESVSQARDDFIQVTEKSHQMVFMKSLAIVCQQAAIAVGFGNIETISGPGHSIRLIATDATGVRSLVTEISNEKDPQLEYEIIGVADGSCHQILNDYSKAIEAQGVRCALPQRRFTGGVPYLATAQEFLKKSVKTQIAPYVQRPKSGTARRRVHRLNQNRKNQIRY